MNNKDLPATDELLYRIDTLIDELQNFRHDLTWKPFKAFNERMSDLISESFNRIDSAIERLCSECEAPQIVIEKSRPLTKEERFYQAYHGEFDRGLI